MIESTILTIIGEKGKAITPAFALPLTTTLIPHSNIPTTKIPPSLPFSALVLFIIKD